MTVSGRRVWGHGQSSTAQRIGGHPPARITAEITLGGPLAQEYEDFRLIEGHEAPEARTVVIRRLGAVPVYGVLHQVGQADPVANELPVLLGPEGPRHQPDLVERLPEAVLRVGKVVPDAGGLGADVVAADQEADVLVHHVGQDGHEHGLSHRQADTIAFRDLRHGGFPFCDHLPRIVLVARANPAAGSHRPRILLAADDVVIGPDAALVSAQRHDASFGPYYMALNQQ